MKKILLWTLLWGLIPLQASAFSPRPTDPTNPPDPGDPTEPVACAENTLRAGEQTETVRVDGTERSYVLRVPSSYDGTRAVPLLLDFHGLMTTASFQRNNSGTATVSEREGFIVAYPQGINNAWNLGPCCTRSRSVDDVAFAKTVVEQVSTQGCIDDKRVYATGLSNGGGMAYKLACDAADTFAAVAPAAFDLIEEMSCSPSRPVSVFAFRGRQDSIVPYEGGRSTPPTFYRLDPIHFKGAVGTFQEWGQLNSCAGSPTSLGGNCQGYTNCGADTEVVLCTDPLGGHSSWDADESWNYLKQHTLP